MTETKRSFLARMINALTSLFRPRAVTRSQAASSAITDASSNATLVTRVETLEAVCIEKFSEFEEMKDIVTALLFSHPNVSVVFSESVRRAVDSDDDDMLSSGSIERKLLN
jgi:hypothetical protein